MRQYTEEFKREIAELVIRSGKSQAQISRETGISNQNISRWVKEYRNNSNTKTEAQGPGWHEYHTLQEDLRRVQEERDILKKALNIFSRKE
ncbi:MAG: transposase [Fermentimonas caenicola]|nr:MAG: transposase [Fermentimonas caenicola]